MVIWKANRSKSKIAQRLLNNEFDNLEDAVYALTMGISNAASPKARLRYIMKEWGFQLPMATAILTALYPEEFTVYDIRVCHELGDCYKLKNLISFENIWSGYQAYIKMVESAAPKCLSLRDKDRFLWGRSFSKQLENDVNQGFSSSIDIINGVNRAIPIKVLSK